MIPLKHSLFPLGHAVTVEQLERDPYDVFARLREREPVSWLHALKMWYVTTYDDVRSALLDTTRLTTVSHRSTIFDTFGLQMLTAEGEPHDRYRSATQYPFALPFVRAHFEAPIAEIAAGLIDEFATERQVELRTAFASPLPVRVILRVCGLPASSESNMRRWYDSFEAALANFAGNPAVRDAAQRSIREFYEMLDIALANAKSSGEHSLISALANAAATDRLNLDEIKRNIAIICFGGISTVEALLLNVLWALFEHPATFARVLNDLSLIPRAVDETMRWLSPVQSATRHVVAAFEWRGVFFEAGDTVNCMIGAANRDRSVFADPDRFDLDRSNVRRHLGFAAGPHSCLGLNLAKTEVRIGLEILLKTLKNLAVDPSLSEPPSGYEFRQSRKLTARWTI